MNKSAAVVLFLFAIVTALGIGEVAVRFLALAPNVERMRVMYSKSAYHLSSNPILGYELKPNYRDNNNPDCHESFPFTNSFGQRDLERSIPRTPGVHRILMLGDSVVAGHGLCNLNDTIPAQLEHILPHTEVLNFGTGGYNTLSEVELLNVKGLQFQPDVVLLVFNENDFDDISSQIDHYLRDDRPAFITNLFFSSSLFRLLSLRFNLFHFVDDLGTQHLDAHRDAIGGDNVHKGFQRIRKLSKDAHFALHIFIWPRIAADGIDTDPEIRGQNPGSLRVEEMASAVGISTTRLADAFLRDLSTRGQPSDPNLIKKLYTIDSLHPSPLGAQIAAQAMLKTSKKLLSPL